MKRQFIALLMATAVMVEGATVMAAEMKPIAAHKVQITEQAVSNNRYMIKTGTVTEIYKEKDSVRILVGTYEDGIQFTLNHKEVVVNAETLEVCMPEQIKEGMEVTVVYPKDAPMTLSMPAGCGAQVAVIINSTNMLTEVNYFNEELVNEENTLALNLSRETKIINTKGEKRIFTDEDIEKHSAVVIYNTTTRSIPAQTTPKMVVILPIEEADETQYISVRELADKLGYKITWDHKTKKVTLTKDENEVCLVVGEASYRINDKAFELKDVVKIEDQKVYVTEELGVLMEEH